MTRRKTFKKLVVFIMIGHFLIKYYFASMILTIFCKKKFQNWLKNDFGAVWSLYHKHEPCLKITRLFKWVMWLFRTNFWTIFPSSTWQDSTFFIKNLKLSFPHFTKSTYNSITSYTHIIVKTIQPLDSLIIHVQSKVKKQDWTLFQSLLLWEGMNPKKLYGVPRNPKEP